MTTENTLRVASYNIHGATGTDGRMSISRISDVICSLKADIIALQEVNIPSGVRRGMIERFADAAKMNYYLGPTLKNHLGSYGNAVLSRMPASKKTNINISFSGREPRGILKMHFQIVSSKICFMATHLGLKRKERTHQIEKLLDEVRNTSEETIIIAGDFNEWFPWNSSWRKLRATFNLPRKPASFPSIFPIFALDRIFINPSKNAVEIKSSYNNLTRKASDHIPIYCDIRLP